MAKKEIDDGYIHGLRVHTDTAILQLYSTWETALGKWIYLRSKGDPVPDCRHFWHTFIIKKRGFDNTPGMPLVELGFSFMIVKSGLWVHYFEGGVYDLATEKFYPLHYAGKMEKDFRMVIDFARFRLAVHEEPYKARSTMINGQIVSYFPDFSTHIVEKHPEPAPCVDALMAEARREKKKTSLCVKEDLTGLDWSDMPEPGLILSNFPKRPTADDIIKLHELAKFFDNSAMMARVIMESKVFKPCTSRSSLPRF